MTAYYEFSGVAFYPEAADKMPMVGPAENLSSLRHIPYSDANVLDLGGQGAYKFGPIEVRVSPTDAGAFEALRQTDGPLTVAGLGYPVAVLMSLTNKRQTIRGEWIFYTAEWVVG